jgi:dihydrofolate reductase
MRKLIESTVVSLDGVIEAPERWTNFDAEATALSLKELGNYDAFVMGRVTYEKFLANWGHVTGDPYVDLISAMPKYVASRSLPQTAWNATLLGPDPSTAIAQLKDQPGKDLIKYGTTRFDDTLVRDHLIDEFRFWIMPVVAGSGQRLFEDVDTSGLDLRLTCQRRLENGSVILTYAPGWAQSVAGRAGMSCNQLSAGGVDGVGGTSMRTSATASKPSSSPSKPA